MTEPDAPRGGARAGGWPLRPGDSLTVVKLAPDGAEAARYPGEVVAVNNPAPWLVVLATWTFRALELDGLAFRPGDLLYEWFSPNDPFNAFAIVTPEGSLRGWYANVTKPARIDSSVEPPLLLWHDLYVDLVGLPDGSYTLRDDDELVASGLGDRDPALFQRILWARGELIRRFTQQLPPFVSSAMRCAATSNISLGTGGQKR